MPFFFQYVLKALLLLVVPLLAACDPVQSALHPGGPSAQAIASVWWVMFWGSLVILTLVMALALIALRATPAEKQYRPGRWFILGGGVLFPVVTLTVLLIYSFEIDYPLFRGESEPMNIEVTGHQWWWEVRYPGAGDAEVVTANEIHIPVGRTVRINVRSADVIHSFWVPRLGGKQDAIPGHENPLDLHADQPGTFRGQCAEFCGAQHAHMAFWVIAEPVERFDAWLARQSQPVSAPAGEAAASRGREHFLQVGCAECHRIRGTAAKGDTGPDLTHVASRRTLAAGTLPMTRENLARWISASQRIKPGNRMEDFSHLDDAVVRDLAAYLHSLE